MAASFQVAGTYAAGALPTSITTADLSGNGRQDIVVADQGGGVDVLMQEAGTGSAGTFAAGSLEMSNVDLGQEFTNMIIAQRGFEANAKVITTSDELLQDLVNLKR